ncbi:MAG: pilus assembly protein N-terminal domain-containing protein [Myxococcales bacterium]|nr:pilus assembly protein N-terminal domain-containing protein [Myxococcales bacterium]
MTCHDVREQLLELPMSEFGSLASHLEGCAACRALAARIVAREEHVSSYVDGYVAAETFGAAWTARGVQAASAESGQRWRSWMFAAACAVAVVGVAWTLLTTPGGGPPLAAAPVDAEDAEPLPDLVQVGVGRSAYLQVDEVLRMVAVVDPDVAEAQTAGSASLLRVIGRSPGRTMLHAAGERDYTWWIEVTESPEAPAQSEVSEFVLLPERSVDVLVSGRALVELPWMPVAIHTADPDVIRISTVGSAQKLAIDGLRPGVTDVLVHGREGAMESLVVTVRGH